VLENLAPAQCRFRSRVAAQLEMAMPANEEIGERAMSSEAGALVKSDHRRYGDAKGLTAVPDLVNDREKFPVASARCSVIADSGGDRLRQLRIAWPEHKPDQRAGPNIAGATTRRRDLAIAGERWGA